MSYKAAIFDMDGTVLDTLTDLRLAINYAMGQAGHKNDFTEDETRTFFGSAVHVAIQRALLREKGADAGELLLIGTEGHETAPGIDEDEVNRIQAIYKPYYDRICSDHTKAYPGIHEAIKRIKASKVLCAVVSNKPDEAVQKLVHDIFPGDFDFALGEKPGTRRKPAPDMTEQSLLALGINKDEAVYIGDSEIDIMTALNSGMDEIAVTWGFRPEEYLKQTGAVTIVHNADELAKAIVG